MIYCGHYFVTVSVVVFDASSPCDCVAGRSREVLRYVPTFDLIGNGMVCGLVASLF